VRTLKDGLLENSIETWFDEDQIDFGDSLISKLENGLDESSHLVIVLSPASIQSEWVKYELKKALNNARTGLMNKIIPIKYRDCEIPEDLTDLIHADLSNEVVLPEGDRVKFISGGYDNFFLKLVRALRNTSKAINKEEKDEIIKSIKAAEKEVGEESKSKYRANLKLLGYSTKDSLEKYQKIIAKKLKSETNLSEYRPILLPPSTKSIFKPKIGDKIDVIDDFIFDSYGHFAGYRNDDLAITVDKRTRDDSQIKALRFYQIEIDPENNLIKFVNEIKTDANK